MMLTYICKLQLPSRKGKRHIVNQAFYFSRKFYMIVSTRINLISNKPSISITCASHDFVLIRLSYISNSINRTDSKDTYVSHLHSDRSNIQISLTHVQPIEHVVTIHPATIQAHALYHKDHKVHKQPCFLLIPTVLCMRAITGLQETSK